MPLITANILSSTLIAMAPDLARLLAPGGRLILSGILTREGAHVMEHYRPAMRRLGSRTERGWTTLTLERAKRSLSEVHRFAFGVNSGAIHADCAALAGSELHHLRDVLRLRRGAPVELIDERGRILGGRIESMDAAQAMIRIERVEEPRGFPPLILALAIIKGPRMDLAIEKAVELGASEVWPLICARCVVRDPGQERLLRWRRVAAAASKQSRAAHAVEIRPPLSFNDLPARLPPGILPVICQAQAPPLAAVAGHATRAGILIVCGPEGDFDSEELAAAQRAGFIRASLGRNRLRTETAALAALAIAASILEQMARAD